MLKDFYTHGSIKRCVWKWEASGVVNFHTVESQALSSLDGVHRNVNSHVVAAMALEPEPGRSPISTPDVQAAGFRWNVLLVQRGEFRPNLSLRVRSSAGPVRFVVTIDCHRWHL